MQTRLSTRPDILKQKFYQLTTRWDISDLLEVPHKALVYYLYRMDETLKYSSFNIPKKNGKTRNIKSPHPSIKILQQKLNYILKHVYSSKPSVHGFIQGKSVVSNAQKHSRRKFVLNIDIQDFFPSINFGRVRGLFLSKPYELPENVATVIAQICCFQNQLPQGAPTSPIISNMICYRLDTQLQRLASRYRCTYTRYVDDITISTTLNRFPDDLAKLDFTTFPATLILGKPLLQIFIGNGFKLNTKKARLQLPQDRHEVTGLTTNLFPNVERRYLNQIRAMLHAWGKYGYELAQKEFLLKYNLKHRNPYTRNIEFRQVVKGKLAYLGMVRGFQDQIYTHYANKLADLDSDFAIAHKFKQKFNEDKNNPSNAVYVLEGNEYQGTGFLLDGVGLITCAHTLEATTLAFKITSLTKKYPIKVLAKDEDIDLAILQIDIEKPISILAGNSDKIKQGDSIKLLGFPNYSIGQTVQVFQGKVTGLKKRFGIDRIMIDAPIAKGNSGGPVLNEKNEVIGIAYTGIDSTDKKLEGEFGVTPINALKLLKR